ncbi:hypothetical protein [Frankia sp. CiP1_Cm_nod2]|uniref:hypothetical protein n=1 Tax=Frankia sp. CiP1_Cm_nod2 TaxID=2897161 RepID=UPI002023D062
MTSRKTPASTLATAAAAAEAAEAAADAAADDLHQTRLAALEAARQVAATRQAEADQAAAELRQREADWAGTLAEQAAAEDAARRAAEQARLVAVRDELAAERQALDDELPELLHRTMEIIHTWARWETRRTDLRGRPAALAKTAAQVLGDASAAALAPYGVETDGLPRLLANQGVPFVAHEVIVKMLLAARATEPPDAEPPAAVAA